MVKLVNLSKILSGRVVRKLLYKYLYYSDREHFNKCENTDNLLFYRNKKGKVERKGYLQKA